MFSRAGGFVRVNGDGTNPGQGVIEIINHDGWCFPYVTHFGDMIMSLRRRLASGPRRATPPGCEAAIDPECQCHGYRDLRSRLVTACGGRGSARASTLVKSQSQRLL
jgi:hypothetical protein